MILGQMMYVLVALRRGYKISFINVHKNRNISWALFNFGRI